MRWVVTLSQQLNSAVFLRRGLQRCIGVRLRINSAVSQMAVVYGSKIWSSRTPPPQCSAAMRAVYIAPSPGLENL